ncbi:MAG: hypothetical protein ISR45_03610 [Rhodospirillales bacterium]|nr:hypothetical protein [Rhodospirillales bacterium]
MSNAIIIHNQEHAEAALGVAHEMGVQVTLISPPAAAAYIGATVFRDMIANAAEHHPEARYQAVLDCGDEPGLALGALRHGIKGVRINNGPELSEKLADIAGQRGAFVYTDEGDELDLYGMSEPAAACRAWLSEPEGIA